MTRVGLTAAMSVALLLAACNESTGGPAGDAPTTPRPLALVIDHADAPHTDTIQVFVCEVPSPTADPIYGDMTLRLELAPAAITSALSAGVPQYFAALSGGRYTPTFIAGTTLHMSATGTHDDCVDVAVSSSSPDATAVMVVADAEHLASEPGGWGRPGTRCTDAPCAAAATGRALYVGASDFYESERGGQPLLDLIEHEIGHTLDLPHSGDPGQPHASALDVMSDSAAARVAQADRVSAQDTLAINRLALGWLPERAVAVAPSDGGAFDLLPSNGEVDTPGTRLLVLPLDDVRFLTVEQLADAGLDDFLETGGIAVHLVDVSAGAGIEREQTTLGSDPPHLRLLHDAGEVWTVEGWTIRLTADIHSNGDPNGDAAQVEVHPTER